MPLVKCRDHLYQKFKITQSAHTWMKYKQMRNRVVKLIRSSKLAFFRNLSNGADDPQKFWKIVNSLKNVSNHIPTLKYNNTMISEDAEKAEVLNTFFSECFNKSDPPLQYSPTQQLRNSSFDMSIIDICEEEVLHMISSLKPKKSPGVYGITAEMLQLVAHCIVPSLTLLLNHILAMGRIPSEWKVGTIIPIPKGTP